MNDEIYKEILRKIELNKVQPSILDCATKALSLIKEITASQKNEIAGIERWSRMYKTRQKTLMQKQRDHGGFDETLSSLERVTDPIDLTLLESPTYVSMFLTNRISDQLIGALYIERDKESI